MERGRPRRCCHQDLLDFLAAYLDCFPDWTTPGPGSWHLNPWTSAALHIHFVRNRRGLPHGLQLCVSARARGSCTYLSLHLKSQSPAEISESDSSKHLACQHLSNSACVAVDGSPNDTLFGTDEPRRSARSFRLNIAMSALLIRVGTRHALTSGSVLGVLAVAVGMLSSPLGQRQTRLAHEQHKCLHPSRFVHDRWSPSLPDQSS